MAVAPDLLLSSAAEIKPRSTPAKANANPSGADKDGPSSFAKVYDKERQSTAAARKSDTAQQARERQNSRDDQAAEAPDAAADTQVVAESGKPLPSAEDSTASSDEHSAEPAEASLDPLLLFGLTGELPAAPVPVSNLLSSVLPSTAEEAEGEADVEVLSELSAVKLAQEQVESNKQPTEASKLLAASPGQAQANSALMKEAAALEEPVQELPELQLQELTGKSLAALKEGAANNSAENFVSRLDALSQAVSQPTAHARVPVLGQSVAMQQGGWSEAVVDRVMLMSSQNLKSAEIQLEPAELGRLDVRISVGQELNQVAFASPHAGVREALDAQMNRLREMFAQQGLGPLDVSVSDQSMQRGWQGQDESAQRRGAQSSAGGGQDEAPLSVVDTPRAAPGSARSLVDYYA